jgi:hypothetical protein
VDVIPFGVAASFAEYAPTRPDSATAIVYGNGMTSLATPTVTIDDVDTTLLEGVPAGEFEIRITSATNVVPGRCYELGHPDYETVERVKVRRIYGDRLQLQHALLYEHASGASSRFCSARMSLTIAANVFGAPAWDCLLRITPVIDSVAQEYRDLAFAVSRYSLTSDVSPSLIQSRLDPQLVAKVGQGTDWTEIIEGARHTLNRDISVSWEHWDLRGRNRAYRDAHLWACLRLVSLQYALSDLRDYYAREYQIVLDQVKASTNVDNDQDGTVEANEGGLVSIPIYRA